MLGAATTVPRSCSFACKSRPEAGERRQPLKDAGADANLDPQTQHAARSTQHAGAGAGSRRHLRLAGIPKVDIPQLAGWLAGGLADGLADWLAVKPSVRRG